jgi:hypothetical protein
MSSTGYRAQGQPRNDHRGAVLQTQAFTNRATTLLDGIMDAFVRKQSIQISVAFPEPICRAQP